MDDLDKILNDAIRVNQHLIAILAQIKGVSEQEIQGRIYDLAIKHDMSIKQVKLLLAQHPEVIERAKTFFGD